MNEEKLYFQNEEGLKLCGILTTPNVKTDKCVILCHGITMDKEEEGIFTKLASRLSDSGLAVFRFDFRAHGESEGESVEMTITGETQDLDAAVKLMRSKGYSQFGVLGASFGGGIVSLFAGDHQELIKTLVLWNPVIDYRCLLEPQLPWPLKYFGEEAMNRIEKQGFTDVGRYRIGKPLIEEMKQIKPWQALENADLPILFVHGDKDSYIPYDDSLKYSNVFPNAELVTIEDGEHGFQENPEQMEEALKVTVEFFKENL